MRNSVRDSLRSGRRNVPVPRGAAAFTLVELLIAILIIGIITTLVLTIAAKGIYQQRKANTLAIMRGTTLALEQFASERPLRNTYGIRRVEVTGSWSGTIEPTFGDYPPYQLEGSNSSGNLNVRMIVEQSYLNGSQSRPANLSQRLFLDLRPNTSSGVTQNNVVRIDTSDPRPNDDNRALYTYLRVFNPRSLDQIPKNAFKPLTRTTTPEMVNPTAAGFNIGSTPNGAIDVLGIHDAWGVPLDYILYVKLERYPRDDGSAGWRVKDRIPVLRSHGLERDAYEAGTFHSGGDIYSVPMPEPEAKVDANGALQNSNRSDNGGWVRARGAAASGSGNQEEDYSYLPSLD